MSDFRVERSSAGPAAKGRVLLEAGVLGAHVALAWRLRAIAWPEVTTPAYLLSRGLLLYRDIKFVHTPGTMATLALAFLLFGVRATVVKAYAIAWPLIAHVFLLRRTRPLGLGCRLAASALFLTLLYEWQGNSVWPTVVMTALCLPLASSLKEGRFVRAGLLIGACILLKQTAAYLLLLAVLALWSGRRFRAARAVALFASLPYLMVGALFLLMGAGREFVEWTVVVPFATASSILSLPRFSYFSAILLTAFLPLVLETLAAWREGEGSESGWLLLVAVGLALICIPRFDLMQVAAAVPCLALGAGRLLARKGRMIRLASAGLVSTLVLSHGAILAAGESFDGRVTFWNEEPAFNRLVDRLRKTDAGRPMLSLLWPNLLPRAGALPPGRLYVHPWLTYYHRFDAVGERIRHSALEPGTVIVGFGASAAPSEHFERIGPYLIERK